MRKLFVDNFCEVKEFVDPWQSKIFWDFSKVDIEPGAVYLISRQQFSENIEQIRALAESGTILPILGNPAEGSETMFRQIQGLGIVDLVRQGRILVVAGGALPADIPALYLENFLPKILDYAENLRAIAEYQEHSTPDRPYKFLFLNGRGRRHRRQLIARLHGLLACAVWTNLDSAAGPVQILPAEYEFDFYRNAQKLPETGFVKYELFNREWGEIYLNSRAYLDTYFSLVTETVFDYPYSFRTEKIWKPVAIGHPFVVASNAGYYRDLHRLGFRTFGHLIDESFDSIDNNHDRLERIAQTVEHLCQEDLAAFIGAAEETCKYNQQHLAELRPKIRQEFPVQFTEYLRAHT